MTPFLMVRKLCSFQDGDQDDTLQLYCKEVVKEDERDEEKDLNQPAQLFGGGACHSNVRKGIYLD